MNYHWSRYTEVAKAQEEKEKKREEERKRKDEETDKKIAERLENLKQKPIKFFFYRLLCYSFGGLFILLCGVCAISLLGYALFSLPSMDAGAWFLVIELIAIVFALR